MKQLFTKLSKTMYFLFTSNGKQLFHAEISTNIINANESHFIAKDSLLNMKGKEIGNCFIEFSKF